MRKIIAAILLTVPLTVSAQSWYILDFESPCASEDVVIETLRSLGERIVNVYQGTVYMENTPVNVDVSEWVNPTTGGVTTVIHQGGSACILLSGQKSTS